MIEAMTEWTEADEALAADVHRVYCRQYEKRFGKPYWTDGDFAKLDEPTKEYDRAFVKWHRLYSGRVEAENKALKQALSGRTVSCSGCEGMARELEALRLVEREARLNHGPTCREDGHAVSPCAMGTALDAAAKARERKA